MTAPDQFLNASEAARRLGVSTKALRLYEERGLLSPHRTDVGWRAYGPEAMRRAAEIVALRHLGFSLAQVQRVLAGDPRGLEPALAAHQARIEAQLGQLGEIVAQIRTMRGDLAQGRAPSAAELGRLSLPSLEPVVAFDLPWPWGGERFELREVRALNYIIGSLGSGKTRLAKQLAEALPGGVFVDLERLQAPPGAMAQQINDDAGLGGRVATTIAWLEEDGAAPSDALTALVIALEQEGSGPLVIDMIEQGLDETAQRAVIAHLRRRGALARPVFAMTRSSALLDLSAVGPDEQILLCPANHNPPMVVTPIPGAPGFEAVATCLASPAVRARTEGMVATRREAQG
ncbi:MerR family transcriptional regulator [Phenylobacterium sp.]|uniref:MerR family transcriptional regulator n=1 Tax=Phenylobacterium sp. TaxID=1871053 RepID=UPI002730EF63|nr:MerR family transcriptional regulator [Phenylobacterium sp.]MDP1618771.1 MerR family transcriptional regulator [Phenylobacterium sp.]MDP1988550.1 MerR family transcriptional regulator [Phenylobacterium sp.]